MGKQANPQPQGSDNTSTGSSVVNHGDVTEPKLVRSPLSGEMIELKPMSALPKSHASIAAIHKDARGFTEEGNSIALHY